MFLSKKKVQNCKLAYFQHIVAVVAKKNELIKNYYIFHSILSFFPFPKQVLKSVLITFFKLHLKHSIYTYIVAHTKMINLLLKNIQ